MPGVIRLIFIFLYLSFLKGVSRSLIFSLYLHDKLWLVNWEAQILVDFQKGKLDLLYRKVYPGLILYAVKYLGGESEFLAEDCVQNAIFRAWERRTKFDSIYTFKAFLYTSMKNEIISIHRKNSAQERYMAQLENEVFFQNSVIDQEAQSILYNAIGELPEKAKTIFEMSFIEGLKNVEIAEKLGLSDSSVKKYKASALDFLRGKLEPTLFSFLFLSL